MTKIASVILNYESSEVLKLTLESIRKQTLKSDLTIVVDNGSSIQDGYKQMMKDYPEVKQINLGANYGTFAANAGIMEAYEAGCDYIFLDDSDGVLDPDCFEKLVGTLQFVRSAGIAGPMFYEIGYAPLMKVNNHTASLIIKQKIGFALGFTDCIGIAMIRREVITDIGGINPEYFAYYNDTDFCARTRKAGFQVLMVGHAKIHHLGAYTTKKVEGLRGFTGIRNRAIFLRKNYPLTSSLAFLFVIPFLLGKWLVKLERREIQMAFFGTFLAISYLLLGKESRFLKRIAMALMGGKVVLQ